MTVPQALGVMAIFVLLPMLLWGVDCGLRWADRRIQRQVLLEGMRLKGCQNPPATTAFVRQQRPATRG